MQPLILASAGLNQTPLDWEGNARRILDAARAADRLGAGMLVTSELGITGYGCEDAFYGPALSERAARHLVELTTDIPEGLVVVVGLPIRLPDGLYNGAAFVARDRVLGIVLKQNLAGDGIHYEPRWFRAWQPGRVVRVPLVDGSKPVPMGDLLIELGGIRLGAEICEDAWVPERPVARLARGAVDIVAGPSASHFAFGKHPVRERLALEGSRAAMCAYVFANALGNEAGRVIYDGQAVIASGGELVARSSLLDFAEFSFAWGAVDVANLRAHRARSSTIEQNDESPHVEHLPDWDWRWADRQVAAQVVPWPGSKEEELARAVALGLHDYLRKSASRGFVVSLSGGVDSAAVATLAAYSWTLSAKALETSELAARLPFLREPASTLSGGMLDTIYQSTENSGTRTREAAAAIAAALGARHHEWNVDSMVHSYRALVEDSLGRSLAWETDDIALQNIQARVRSPGAWMMANIRGALLLSTSNRSEAAVGYATMDGDTSGSLAPIAGVDKPFLRRWLEWAATEGLPEVGPLPALKQVLSMPPTAELRPPDRLQTDEADLMPYELLNDIEALAIRDRMEPVAILQRLESSWATRVGGREQLVAYIRRFFQLWARNQWKRERYAPSFHLDDKNLDPRSWCRFPILSGGYREELGELNAPAQTIDIASIKRTAS